MQVMRLAYQLVVKQSEAPDSEQEPPADPQHPPKRAQGTPASAMFYRIAHFVRDTIKLHVSLAAGEIPALPRPSLRHTDAHDQSYRAATSGPADLSPATGPDPRFKPVANYLLSAMKAAPRGRCKPNTMEKMPGRLHETLKADPGLTLTGAQVAVKLCKEFRLPYNIAKLSQDPVLSGNPGKPASGTGPPSP